MSIKLPISKSIANRILLLQAIHGDELMPVSSDMPDDVIILHDALQKIRDTFGTPNKRISPPFTGEELCSSERPVDGRRTSQGVGLTLNLKNCGTALRFLQVHLQQCYPGEPITLDGDPRLKERDGKPTSQTTSALILHGIDVPVEPNESPYITMSRRIMREGVNELMNEGIEADWSAAAFWYEYVAIHGGEVLLEGLKENSLQGDRVVADIYAKYFGVETTFVEGGAWIKKSSIINYQSSIAIDFCNCIDLYPAIALTCEKLSIALNATGTERLRFKESDRLEAVRLHEVRNDHRMAMALMAADYTISKKEQACISKSYPQFAELMESVTRQNRDHTATTPRPVGTVAHITPIKGVNDDNLGKKHALSKLIHAADTEYVWLHDDDVILPVSAKKPNLTFPGGREQALDLIILPLRMESNSLLLGRAGVGLLEKLQIAEYAAIQELTMRMAKKERAVMCSGANLIVKREVWLACEEELHPEIPSGDDMFLLEAVKRHGYKIGVIDEPDYTAIVRPQTTWRAFFRQRMRWAGKAPKYTDKDIIRCGALVAAANILQILCPLIILIKFPIEYNLIRKRLTPPFTGEELCSSERPVDGRRTSQGVGLFFVALLLEIVYPIYLLISLLGGLFSRRAW